MAFSYKLENFNFSFSDKFYFGKKSLHYREIFIISNYKELILSLFLKISFYFTKVYLLNGEHALLKKRFQTKYIKKKCKSSLAIDFKVF